MFYDKQQFLILLRNKFYLHTLQGYMEESDLL